MSIKERYPNIIRILKVAFVLCAICVVIFVATRLGFAEAQPTMAYVICQPGDYVNARSTPHLHTDENIIGRYDSGDVIWVDGKTQNGFMHCVNASLEQDECWVYVGYIVFDKPEWMNGRTATVVSNGRLAARQNTCGKIRLWMNNGATIQVFWRTDEWCVTSCGFVMTEWLEVDGE